MSNQRRIRADAVARVVAEHAWLFALVTGAVLGLVILGVGGRVAMRLFALHTGVRPGLTLGGTTTVIAMGVLSGVAGGAIRAAAATWLPRRVPLAVGTTVFALACLLLTHRGLRPVDATRLTYFVPLSVAYVVAFELVWRRWWVRRISTRANEPAASPERSA